MLSAVAYVRDSVANKRNSERFQIVYTKASEMCQILDLSPIALPRTRNPPKRLTGQACAHVHSSPSEYYKTEFYKVLDVVDMQFRERFEQEGLLMLRNLENILLTGVVDDNVVQMYPELDKISLTHNWQCSDQSIICSPAVKQQASFRGCVQKSVVFLIRWKHLSDCFLSLPCPQQKLREVSVVSGG